MTWVIKLSLLLAVLVRTNLTDHYIRAEGDEYSFDLPYDSDYCLLFRTSGEKNLLLWNTSNPLPENTLTEELRGRLGVEMIGLYSTYIVISLIQSDSGQYRMECWRNGSETDQDTRDLLVCSHYNGRKDLYVEPGQTVELQCEETRDDANMTVLWYEEKSKLSEKSSILQLNITVGDEDMSRFMCALMKEQLCVSYQDFYMNIKVAYLVVSVGEESVLSCFNQDDLNGTETWWDTSFYKLKWDPSSLSRTEKQMYVTDGRTTGNYSLVFTSLMLNHTGEYKCWSNKPFTIKYYIILVFLKSESDLITEFFSEGEQVVLRCNSNITKYHRVVWFRRTAEGEHVFMDTLYKQPYLAQDLDGRINASQPGSFLVLSNLTLKDTGEYWCGVFNRKGCVSVTKTLLLEWDPFGINSTFYRVYSTLMGCALLGMVCALIHVILKTKRRDQDSLKTRSRDQVDQVKRLGFPVDQEDCSPDTERSSRV